MSRPQTTLSESAGAPAPGFEDPVLDAAAAFRAILEAMARPGQPQTLPTLPPAPDGLPAEAAAVCLTLMDHDTPVWLHADFRTEAIGAYLRFHCGLRLTDEIAACRFALLPLAKAAKRIDRMDAGTPSYPDRSATAVLVADAMTGGLPARLAGPGIESAVRFAPAGADSAFWCALAANATRYPLGIDTLIAGGGALAGLPRGTAIEPEGS